MTVLLREAIGDRLRHARTSQSRTLRDVSRAARVSLGYLSEVERGQKEASSELLAAICEALALPLSELMGYVAADIYALDEMHRVSNPQVSMARRPAGSMIEGARSTPAIVGNHLVDLRLKPALRHEFSSTIASRDNGVAVGV